MLLTETTIALIAASMTALLVFTMGFIGGIIYVKEFAKLWKRQHVEQMADVEKMTLMILNNHIQNFKQNVLEQFQEAQEMHQDRHMHGYDHEFGDEDEEEENEFNEGEEDDDDDDSDPELDPTLN